MAKKYDVTALGELLIDFTMNGESGQGNPLFEANPGGAPCNVLAMLQKLGKKTAFIGKIGNDMFGSMLEERVKSTGINLDGLQKDDSVRTTLAFVRTFEDGDRDFSFYRNPGADMMLREEEVDEQLIREARIFHFGTLSMTDEVVERATKRAIRVAKEAGCLLSFDPNLRPPLWSSLEKAKEKIAYGMSVCDILKISDNEIAFMTGTSDIDTGIAMIREQYQIPLVLATLGKDGSKAYYKDMVVSVPGFVNPHTIETTGAGDTFCACALNYVLEHEGVQGVESKQGAEGLNGMYDSGTMLENLNSEDLKALLTFANGAASLITTRKGALCVMPEREEVLEYIGKYHKDTVTTLDELDVEIE
uniref:PfkB family carbohydrate kinase n=1 Tax=Acetatifactor sp. TaxID=1872090 RepID=UPI0040575292